MVTKLDFFEDIATLLKYWAETASDAATNPSANLVWVEAEAPYREVQRAFEEGQVDTAAVQLVVSEALRGFAMNLLTILDGGTESAEKGRLYLTDERGKKLGEGLHAEFIGHLLTTGRMK